jgi:hypothetical protein
MNADKVLGGKGETRQASRGKRRKGPREAREVSGEERAISERTGQGGDRPRRVTQAARQQALKAASRSLDSINDLFVVQDVSPAKRIPERAFFNEVHFVVEDGFQVVYLVHPVVQTPIRILGETHQNVYAAVRPEIFTQNRAEKGKLFDFPLLAEENFMEPPMDADGLGERRKGEKSRKRIGTRISSMERITRIIVFWIVD